MRIAVLSMAIGAEYGAAVQSGVAATSAYCARHGYDYLMFDRLPYPVERPPSWYKLLLVCDHLDRYDWLLWLDADALIMRPEVSLESFADDAYDFVMSPDGVHAVNCGAWLVRSVPSVKDFLRKVFGDPDWQTRHYWEQEPFNALVDFGRVKQLETFNRMVPWPTTRPSTTYRVGDFILHIAGVHRWQGAEVFKAYMDYYALSIER